MINDESPKNSHLLNNPIMQAMIPNIKIRITTIRFKIKIEEKQKDKNFHCQSLVFIGKVK
jgi:hypothetical protein